MRFVQTRANQFVGNLEWLRSGGWAKIEEHFKKLVDISGQPSAEKRIEGERSAVNLVMGRNRGFHGVGPKQARNLWQMIGATQYEIPLDSRLCAWLKERKPPFEIDGKKLGSVRYAAVFSNADRDAWKEEEEDEDCASMFAR